MRLSGAEDERSELSRLFKIIAYVRPIFVCINEVKNNANPRQSMNPGEFA